MSKYEALEMHLRRLPAQDEVITMSFDEIAAVLGTALPESAYVHRPWWGNQRNLRNRPQAQAWLSAGIEVDSVKQAMPDAHVTFRRAR